MIPFLQNAASLSAVIVRESGRSSIPEAVAIEPRQHGALDTSPARGMTTHSMERVSPPLAQPSHMLPAVDVNLRAVHVRARVRAQHIDDLGHLVRRAQAMHRDLLGYDLLGAGGED